MPKPELTHRIPSEKFCHANDGCGFMTPNKWNPRCATCRRKIDYKALQIDMLLGLKHVQGEQLSWMHLVLNHGAKYVRSHIRASQLSTRQRAQRLRGTKTGRWASPEVHWHWGS